MKITGDTKKLRVICFVYHNTQEGPFILMANLTRLGDSWKDAIGMSVWILQARNLKTGQPDPFTVGDMQVWTFPHKGTPHCDIRTHADFFLLSGRHVSSKAVLHTNIREKTVQNGRMDAWVGNTEPMEIQGTHRGCPSTPVSWPIKVYSMPFLRHTTSHRI